MARSASSTWTCSAAGASAAAPDARTVEELGGARRGARRREAQRRGRGRAHAVRGGESHACLAARGNVSGGDLEVGRFGHPPGHTYLLREGRGTRADLEDDVRGCALRVDVTAERPLAIRLRGPGI